MFQRISGLLLACSVLLLSGCDMTSVKDFFNDKMEQVIQQDQQHEQGFVVDKDVLYAAFDTSSHHIDLSNKGLVAIPDICVLLDRNDVEEVWSLDLSHNNIRILNTDLSCLTYLKELDLSHNQIQAVQSLGDLPALRTLDMEHNELATTADFPDFPVLEKLNLAYNKLKEVKDLDHLKNLIVLELQHNVIDRLIGVERLEKLKELRVDVEKLKAGDMSPIIEKLEELEIIDQLGNTIGEAIKDKLKSGLVPF